MTHELWDLVVSKGRMVETERLAEDHLMQGLYYRPNPRTPWVFIGRTRSVADAEEKARTRAKAEGRGRILYLEAQDLPSDVWDLRSLPHRHLGGWLCKALLAEYRAEKRNNRKVWKKRNLRQLSLFA